MSFTINYNVFSSPYLLSFQAQNSLIVCGFYGVLWSYLASAHVTTMSLIPDLKYVCQNKDTM